MKAWIVIHLFFFHTYNTCILCFMSGYDFIWDWTFHFPVCYKSQGPLWLQDFHVFCQKYDQLQELYVQQEARVWPVSEEFKPFLFCVNVSWLPTHGKDESICLSRTCTLPLVIQQIELLVTFCLQTTTAWDFTESFCLRREKIFGCVRSDQNIWFMMKKWARSR